MRERRGSVPVRVAGEKACKTDQVEEEDDAEESSVDVEEGVSGMAEKSRVSLFRQLRKTTFLQVIEGRPGAY